MLEKCVRSVAEMSYSVGVQRVYEYAEAAMRQHVLMWYV